MRNAILIAACVVGLSACATAPTLTPADYQARARLHPITLQLSGECMDYARNCSTARNLLVRDPAVTPNMITLFDNAVRSRQVGNFLRDVILGPEQRFRSCYRSECVTTVYRQTPDGRVTSARSY